MIKIDLQFNKEEGRQELAFYDPKTNKASYVYVQKDLPFDYNLEAFVKWLNNCFKEIDE